MYLPPLDKYKYTRSPSSPPAIQEMSCITGLNVSRNLSSTFCTSLRLCHATARKEQRACDWPRLAPPGAQRRGAVTGRPTRTIGLGAGRTVPEKKGNVGGSWVGSVLFPDGGRGANRQSHRYSPRFAGRGTEAAQGPPAQGTAPLPLPFTLVCLTLILSPL